jgi:AcrR family transcriptional regulator
MPTAAIATRRGHAAQAEPRNSRNVLERDGILDAAMGVLLETGPGRMRLADLARQLGVVPSALHYHFPAGKEEVIAALFDREEARVVEGMTTAVAAADEPRGRLLAMATARLQNATRLARLYPSDGAARGRRPARGPAPANDIQDYVMQRRQGFLNTERQIIAGILREVAGRRLSASSLDLLAAAFQGALFNVTRTFSLTTSRKSAAALTELVDVFVRGIEAVRRRTP